MPARRPRRTRRRRFRYPRLTARRLAAVLLVLVGLLYYRPITSYLHTRDEVARRSEEVKALRAERRALAARFEAGTSALTLAREARRLSLVRTGERLFVIQGIERWRRTHARQLR